MIRGAPLLTLRAFMSKPALGRGLGSLLNGSPPPAAEAPSEPAPAAGVNLLLQGRDAEETEMESPAPATLWLVPLLFGADAFLVIAGALLLASSHPIARWVAGGILILVGGSLAIAAVMLQGRRAGPARPQMLRPTTTSAAGTPAVPGPRVRVHFVDELPRQRKN